MKEEEREKINGRKGREEKGEYKRDIAKLWWR